MFFLPVVRYEIRARGTPREIVAALSEHVQGFPVVTRLWGHKTFAGSVSELGFRLVRVGRHRNPSRPGIGGRFTGSGGSTTIRVTIKHDAFFWIPVGIIFSCFSLPALNSMLLPLMMAFLAKDPEAVQRYLSAPHLVFLLLPVGVLLISYASALIFFEDEAASASRELADILAPFLMTVDEP